MLVNDFFTITKFVSQIIFRISACLFVLYVCYLLTADFTKSIKGWSVSRWIKRRCKIAKHNSKFQAQNEYYSVDFYPLQFSNTLSSWALLFKTLDKNASLQQIPLDKYEIKQVLEDLDKAQQLHYSTVVKTPNGYARLFFKNDVLLKEFLDKKTN
jgi:hypothetical protein